MILDDIKQKLTNEGITTPIAFNYSQAKGSVIVLWQYDGVVSDVGRNPYVQITVKDLDMAVAQTIAEQIYDILYPVGQFQKILLVNSKKMKVKPIQEPFYNEKDDDNRHCFVFNVSFKYIRS